MPKKRRSLGRKLRIVTDDHGVELHNDNLNTIRWRIAWNDVNEIAAWKDDVFAYDIICIGFRIAAKVDFYLCDEEQNGWKELQKGLERKFGIQEPTWWHKVAFPAFVTNWTVLWSKP